MALIKTGSIVADISGKVGDNIYSRNASGPYVKTFAAPTITPSTYTAAAQQALADANVAWQNLTDIQFNNWVQFSKQFPRPTFHNGYQSIDPKALFVSSFINLYYTGLTPSPLPIPPNGSGFNKIDLDLAASPNPLIYIRGGVTNSDYKVNLYSNVHQPSSIRSINTIPTYYFKTVDYVPNSGIDFQGDFLTRFGALPLSPGRRLFMKAKVIHVQSGIAVNKGWNNQIFAGTLTPGTLGKTTIGGTLRSQPNGHALPVTAPYDGFINSLSLYRDQRANTIQFAVYNDLGGKANSLLAQTLPVSNNNPDGWRTLSLTSPLAITAGTKYHLAAFCDGNLAFYYDSGPSNNDSSSVTTLPPPNPFGWNNFNTIVASIYANCDFLI